MKISILSTYDTVGGAARAAYRLHQGLQSIGVDSQMLVQAKTNDDPSAIAPGTKLQKGLAKLKPIVDLLPLEFYRNRDKSVAYSLQWLRDRKIARQVAQIDPDIINLHWVNAGYLQIEALAEFKQPIVWTIHDMWAFTGGCHYSYECDRYTKSCGACPQLRSKSDWDLSRWVWQRKAKAWNNLNLTIVSPSNWLAQCARASSLFENVPIEVIPNGLDIQKYKPIDKQLAKNILGLPSDKLIVLFGAINSTSDPRKGFHLLLPALQKLSQSEWKDKIEVVVFGASQPAQSPNFNFRARYLGRLYDDISLATVYSSADVMVVPSIQEIFGQTASESLACGTPVVAFNATGLKEIVNHQENGYLAQPFDIEDLSQGIIWVLENAERRYKLSKNAREKVEQEFSLSLQANRYFSLFNKILACEKEGFPKLIQKY